MDELVTLEVPEQNQRKSSFMSSKSSQERSDQKVTFSTGTFNKKTKEDLERQRRFRKKVGPKNWMVKASKIINPFENQFQKRG